MNSNNKIIAALDLGADKIVCLIGYINSIGKICIKGVGHQKSMGIMNGTIIDTKATVQSVISAISVAERMAGYNIDKIVVNISGQHISSNNVKAKLNINGRVINQKDISNLAKNVRSAFKRQGKEIIHLIPIDYTVDGSSGIKNPRNIIGDMLSIDFHTVITNENNMKNIDQCIKKTPLTINNYISSAYASALACLTNNEMEMGTLLIDIGGSNSSFCVIYEDKFLYNSNISIGGINITKDIALILTVDFSIAEKIKTLNTDLTLNSNEEDELIKIDIDDDSSFKAAQAKRGMINNIYKSRIEEMMRIIYGKINQQKLDGLIRNIVITGGTSLTPGLDAYINKLTKKPVRVGSPDSIVASTPILIKNLQNPIYSCSVGTLKFLQKMSEQRKLEDFKSIGNSKFKRLFSTLNRFFIS